MNKYFFLLLSFIVFVSSLSVQAYSPVQAGYDFSFPKDHASHPTYKTEWWYFTGHFKSEEGKEFGFQWTVFRTALKDKKSAKNCVWCSTQIYLGHAALSDLSEKKFYYDEAISRELQNIAFSSDENFEVKLPRYAGSSQAKSWTIQNSNAQFSYDLKLNLPDSLVLHGEKGYAPKSSEAGKASYYYSIPHIPLKGTLEFQGKKIKVKGQAWMDHEFASSALSDNQSGWDWFGLPLTDKSSLMLYRLRHKSDTKQDFVFATYVNEQGQHYTLSKEDIQLTPLKTWKSTLSKSTYPIQWKIEVPKHQLNLLVTAHFENQELNTMESTQVIYWEGSVGIEGKIKDAKIDSKGYLEMTGYDEKYGPKI